MGVWNRSLALLLGVILASVAAPQETQQVTTHGGGPQRTNWYQPASPPWLCQDWDSAMGGRSYTQPLMVRDNVYVLGGNHLYRFDLQGNKIGSLKFTTGLSSHGQLTYHLGTSPDEDVLFVPTPGPPYGLAMIRTQTIVGEETFAGDLLWRVEGDSYVVTAPLYFPELGAVVFGTSNGAGNGAVWLAWTRGDAPIRRYPPRDTAGWISGSPIRVSDNQFVIGVKNGLRRLTIDSGDLISLNADLVKTLPAAPNGEVLSAISGAGVNRDGFATVIYFVDKLGNLYKADTTLGSTLTDQWADLDPHPQVFGFNNSGPALDDKYVYLPIRWPLATGFGTDASAPDYKPWHGSMSAFDKETGERVWSHTMTAGATPTNEKPSWVNQEPIVYGGGRDADQNLKPRVVLAGDAGGRVWAWDGEGNPMPFALVDDQQVPISCDSLEGPDPPATVHYSAVAALTDRPHVVDSWSPESGVAIGLMFARDRLLTGVNENVGGDIQSRLVALRSGTNAWIQSMTFSQNGQELPPERLNPGQPVNVKVTAAWSVTGAGRTLAPLTVYAGWPDQPVDERWVKTITPTGSLGQKPLDFELPPRTAVGQSTIAAVLNPELLIRRQPKEEGAAPIPAKWGEYFAQAATDANLTNRGEVLVGDNLVTQTVGPPIPPVVDLRVDPTNACTGQKIKYTPEYRDSQGLPRAAEQGEPYGWPPPARFETPTIVNIRYRAKNSAGTWSEWVEKALTLRDCSVPPPPPSAAFDVAFDPAVGHRGHHINVQVTVHRTDEIDSHTITSFNVDQVTVTLPDALQGLSACVGYQSECWKAPNEPGATGSDLDWHYSFDLPAPSVTPEDGTYTVKVAATGTYTWQHWHPHIVKECQTDPATGKETCEEFDEGENHPHTDTWSATQQVTFTVTGGHQFVHPATDHD